MKKPEKFYKVKHDSVITILSGLEVATLQLSGSRVKVIKKVYKCPSCNDWTWNIALRQCTKCKSKK